MRGPQYMLDTVHTQLNTVRELRKGFSDTDLKPNLTDFPEAKAEFEPHAVPKSKAAVQKECFKVVLKSLISRTDGTHDERPAIAVPAKDATWHAFQGQSSVLVTSADGNSASWCRRNNPLFRKQSCAACTCRRSSSSAGIGSPPSTRPQISPAWSIGSRSSAIRGDSTTYSQRGRCFM